MLEMMPGRKRRVDAVIGAVVVLAYSFAACSRDTPSPSLKPAVASSGPDGKPSQSPAEAKRDGVFPAVADLPTRLRVHALSTVRIDDETWAISVLTQRGMNRIGCEAPNDGVYGRDYVCANEYGELVQIEGDRVVHALPLPSVPPRYIAITDDAVFCARQGDGALGDSMVCRVDRRTHQRTVRVFPAPLESGWRDGGRRLPKGWTLDDNELEVSKLVVDDDGVWAKSYKNDWTKLDAETLEVVERGISQVTSGL